MPNDRAFSAGLADERSARLNPGALHLAIAHAARDAGAAIHQDHRAEDIRPAGDEAVVSVRGQEVRARHVVVATNGFTHTTVAPFHDYLLPVGSFAILTGPLDERIRLGALGRGRCHATSYRVPHYVRVTEGRRLLFGGRASLTTQADIEACGRWLLGRAQRIFPDLGLTRAEACWGGRLGFTPDKRPLLGQLSGQVLYAMGCAGHGVPTSLAMARDIADTILRRPLGDRAPFWRSPGEPPQRVSGLLRRGLPVAQIGLRCLDTGDRLRDALPGRVGPPHDGAAA
jgi:gamma-glutamylputrescine oxidase